MPEPEPEPEPEPSPSPVEESTSTQPNVPGGGCLREWAQCGGQGWTGQGSCCSGLECHVDNPWWSMCMTAALPSTVSTSNAAATTGAASTTPAASSTMEPPPASRTTMPEPEPEPEPEPSPSPVEESTSTQPNVPGGGCLREWAQCGGQGWTGQGSCCSGLECQVDNPWWSMCVTAAPDATQPVLPSSTTLLTTAGRAEPDGDCLEAWSQCGGRDWQGQGTCCDGTQCQFDNDWWSACVPSASLAQARGAGSGAQRASSFLAPIHRHALHVAPALVQGGSALSKTGPADVRSKHRDSGKEDEL